MTNRTGESPASVQWSACSHDLVQAVKATASGLDPGMGSPQCGR
jgi:hypothetical protein